MSILERRVQLLLDADRFERLATEAQRSGRSVNAVIRDAIDFRYPADAEARTLALGEFLGLVRSGPGETDEWAVLKDEIARSTDEHLVR